MLVDLNDDTLMLVGLPDDMLRAIAKQLVESDLASAVALKRCSSRFKDLATPLVANAVERMDEKWRDAAAQIGGRGAATITGGLERNEVLADLNLGNNRIRDEGAAAIAEALRGNAVLKTLDLKYNQIRAEGAAAIAEALRGNGVLTSLDVGWNSLTEEAALSIVRVERQRNKLTSLGLGSCGIGPTGAAEIAEYVSGSGVLTSLDVSFNKLTEEAALGIVRVERHARWRNKLTSLGLGRCSIGPTGAAEIAEYVSGSGVLTKLNLDGHELDLPKLRGTDPAASLDLTSKKLGPASAIVIASLIAGNEVLTELSLPYNSIGDEGAVARGAARQRGADRA